MRKIISSTMAVLALSLATAPLATAADLKVGLVLTLSGPPGALGKQAQDGFNLAVKHLADHWVGPKQPLWWPMMN